MTKTATQLMQQLKQERAIPETLITGRKLNAAGELTGKGAARWREVGGMQYLTVHVVVVGG